MDNLSVMSSELNIFNTDNENLKFLAQHRQNQDEFRTENLYVRQYQYKTIYVKKIKLQLKTGWT